MPGNESSAPTPSVSGKRKLAAIMFTDIMDFSCQMSSNETRMLRLLDLNNRLIGRAVTEHHGLVIKTVGDAFLVDFPSVVHAVQGAQQIQAQFRADNTEKENIEQIHVRIGVHLGDIVQKDGDVFGDGVDIVSRLQALAEPDTICISEVVYQEVSKKLNLGTVVSLGRPQLTNMAERFQVYALLPVPPTGVRRRLQVQRLKLTRWVSTALRVVGIVVLLGFMSVSSIVMKNRYFSVSSDLPLPDKPSIVVLPFVNMGNESSQDYRYANVMRSN